MTNLLRRPRAARPPRVATLSWPVAGLIAVGLLFAAPDPARAVINGTSSSLGAHTVQLVGGHHCTGVAIARQAIVTASHCASRRARVLAGGATIAIAGVSRSAALDDGRRVSVSGDAAIVRLASPLPGSISPASIGPGAGDSYTIAGYGTQDEAARGAFGALNETRLVRASRHALVDPNRTGSIGASACFGDSGGPVLRGGELVGVITRAAHPHPRIACGHLTRWAPVIVRGGAAGAAGAPAMQAYAAAEDVARAEAPRRGKRGQRQAGARPMQMTEFAPGAWVGRVE
jgi:hypothetical protein